MKMLWVLALTVVSCGGATSLANTDGGNTVGGTPDLVTSGSPDIALTDKQLCDQTCTALAGCGDVEPIDHCNTNCQAAVAKMASYATCLAAAQGDCHAIAVCQWTAVCNGKGPSGGATCSQGVMCHGWCNVNDPVAQCYCGCVAAMAPANVLDLTIWDICVNVRCPQYCCVGGPSCSGAACNSCGTALCQDHAQCFAH